MPDKDDPAPVPVQQDEPEDDHWHWLDDRTGRIYHEGDVFGVRSGRDVTLHRLRCTCDPVPEWIVDNAEAKGWDLSPDVAPLPRPRPPRSHRDDESLRRWEARHPSVRFPSVSAEAGTQGDCEHCATRRKDDESLRRRVRERLARIDQDDIEGGYSVVEMATDLERLARVQLSGLCVRDGCRAGDLPAEAETALLHQPVIGGNMGELSLRVEHALPGFKVTSLSMDNAGKLDIRLETL